MAFGLLGAIGSEAPAAQSATAIAYERRHVIVNDPANPAGMQIRRARAKGEAWPDYFCAVYLWPYNGEHYNRIFTTLNQGGRRIQFIGNAGGVHEVLDEERARRQFSVIRDISEFIERIYREELEKKR
jgi:hypothetical protein